MPLQRPSEAAKKLISESLFVAFLIFSKCQSSHNGAMDVAVGLAFENLKKNSTKNRPRLNFFTASICALRFTELTRLSHKPYVKFATSACRSCRKHSSAILKSIWPASCFCNLDKHLTQLSREFVRNAG